MEHDGGGDDDAMIIPICCRRGARLHFSWGTGDELRLCDVHSPQSAGPQHAPSTSHALQWGSPGVTQRRVAYDSLHLFQELQHIRRTVPEAETEWWPQVLDYSRAVSAVLGRVHDPMKPEAVGLEEEEEELGLQRAIWELIEFFYVDRTETNGIATEDLVQWLQRNAGALQLHNCTLAVQQLLPSLHSQPSPEHDPQYWQCMLTLVALGWTRAAIDLLRMHSAWGHHAHGRGGAASAAEPQIRVLEALAVLLENAPRMKRATLPDPTGGKAYTSTAQFLHHRKGWLEQCSALLEDAGLWDACAAEGGHTAEGAQRVLHALVGNEAVLEEATESWVELLAAELLHKYPALKKQRELRPLVERCMERKRGGEGLLDQLVLSIMDEDVQEVARVCSNHFGNWMMAHVMELLALAGQGAASQLARPLPPSLGGDQVEFYRLEYVSSLMPHALTWRVAASYLAWCPAHGATVLEQLISRLPVHMDSRLAFKALHVCEQHGMHAAAASVCRVMGMDAWRRRHVVSAIKWLQRAHDDRRLTSMARQLEEGVVRGLATRGLGEEDEGGDLDQLELLLESLGGVLRSGGALEFIQQCRRLRKELARVGELKVQLSRFGGQATEDEVDTVEEELAQASAAARGAVMSLLCAPTAPRHFWATILFQAVPLLEGTRLVFSAVETQELISRLQEMSTSHRAEYLSFAGDKMLTAEAQLQVVRLALARNLSRAFVEEAGMGA